ncbi:MAG: hypothetical protein PHO64_14075, partial [Thiomonas sp.]|nr:hypothetical protein [Thiomonas sp.]
MSAIPLITSGAPLAVRPAVLRHRAPGGVIALCALLAIALSAAMPLLADAAGALVLDAAQQPRALAALGLMLLAVVRLLWPSGRWMTYGLTLLALAAGLLWLGVPPAL